MAETFLNRNRNCGDLILIFVVFIAGVITIGSCGMIFNPTPKSCEDGHDYRFEASSGDFVCSKCLDRTKDP